MLHVSCCVMNVFAPRLTVVSLIWIPQVIGRGGAWLPGGSRLQMDGGESHQCPGLRRRMSVVSTVAYSDKKMSY